jgi:hypothetical protein
MTIEEYLRKRIEDLQDGLCNSSLVQGKILAFKEILSKLPEIEHEVTLREVMEMCGDCSNCPYPVSPINPYGCWFDDVPGKWPVYDIKKRMKEVRK